MVTKKLFLLSPTRALRATRGALRNPDVVDPIGRQCKPGIVVIAPQSQVGNHKRTENKLINEMIRKLAQRLSAKKPVQRTESNQALQENGGNFYEDLLEKYGTTSPEIEAWMERTDELVTIFLISVKYMNYNVTNNRENKRTFNAQSTISRSTLCSLLAAHNHREWPIVKLLERDTVKRVTIIEYITSLLQPKVGSIIVWIRSPHKKMIAIIVWIRSPHKKMIVKEWISTTEENVSKTNTRMQAQHLEKVRHAEYKMRRRINSVQLDLCNSGTLHSFLAAHNPIEWFIDNLTNIATDNLTNIVMAQ